LTGPVLTTAQEPAVSLARYGSVVADILRQRFATEVDDPYLAAPMSDYPTRAGKALRPSLCLATCEAFGGSLDNALPSAVAIELLHNAFLVHDDIEDESLLRRGEPTLHRRYGTPLALNAGDGLALLAMGTLRENIDLVGPRLAGRIMTEFDFMSRQTVAGQALELGWCRDNRTDLEPDDYLDLIMKKTCWYTTVLPLRVGALIGSGGTAALDPMIEFGFHLGAAFQIRDDILNVIGDPAVYGKEAFGDLREGKRTLMLIHLLAAADPPDRRWLVDYLARDPAARRGEDVARVLELMMSYGSIGFAGEFAAGVARSAMSSMDAAFAGVDDSPARRFIALLVPFMIERAA
jgi:geranylgeranyl diphosphate synthase type II